MTRSINCHLLGHSGKLLLGRKKKKRFWILPKSSRNVLFSFCFVTKSYLPRHAKACPRCPRVKRMAKIDNHHVHFTMPNYWGNMDKCSISMPIAKTFTLCRLSTQVTDLRVNPKQNKKLIKMCNYYYVTLKCSSFKLSICNHKVLRPIKHVILEYKLVGK